MLKGKIGKSTKKTEKLHTLGMKVLFPVFLAMFGFFICLMLGGRETKKLADQYIEDTAGLYVEQINKDIFQINNELIQVLEKRDIQEIPDYFEPGMQEYYGMLSDIKEQNRLLKIRYEEVQDFFVYSKKPDVLIGDEGTVFSTSQVEGFTEKLRNFFREAADKNYGVTAWNFLKEKDNVYVVGWYAKKEKVVGCVMELDTVFSLLEDMVQDYEIIPFMKVNSGEILCSERVSSNYQKKIAGLKEGQYYEYQLGTIGQMCVYVLSNNGVLETVLTIQTVLSVLIIVWLMICILFAIRYYQSLMNPLQNFVEGILNMEEEQLLNEDGTNNIVELEAVSDRFRVLLRKIQMLKISIYEKELKEKEAELEYMQEQIRPHFFLNCLSLIHGIADRQGETDIVYIVKILSEYMRYNYRESGKERNLNEEIGHVKKYIEIQKLRYGEEALQFEVLEEDVGDDVKIPSLLLQTLVENSVVHGVNLDHLVKIFLYITTETIEGEKYLYVCVSDTGKGFSPEILEALSEDKSIVYGGRKHVGLQNIKRRLELLYGGKAEIVIQNMDENYGAVVEVRIPQKVLVK